MVVVSRAGGSEGMVSSAGWFRKGGLLVLFGHRDGRKSSRLKGEVSMWQKWDEADRRSSSPSYRSPQLFSPPSV